MEGTKEGLSKSWPYRNEILPVPKLEPEQPELISPLKADKSLILSIKEEPDVILPEESEEVKVLPDLEFIRGNLTTACKEEPLSLPLVQPEEIPVYPTITSIKVENDDNYFDDQPLEDPLGCATLTLGDSVSLHFEVKEEPVENMEVEASQQSENLLLETISDDIDIKDECFTVEYNDETEDCQESENLLHNKDVNVKGQSSKSKKLKPGDAASQTSKSSFTCELCPEKFMKNRITKYINHMMASHENSKCKKTLRCRRCSKQFATSYMYNRHVNYHRVEISMPLACPVCEMRFGKKKKEEFKRHVTGHNPHLCQTCSGAFESNFIMRQHERKEHPEIFTHCCTLCDKKYSVECFLDTHVNTHAEGPYFCTVCSNKVTVFNCRLALARHLRIIHSGESVNDDKVPLDLDVDEMMELSKTERNKKVKKFKCIYCEEEFFTLADRRCHLKEHPEASTPGRFACHLCEGKVYSTLNVLRRHLRDIHAEEEDTYEECKLCTLKKPH